MRAVAFGVVAVLVGCAPAGDEVVDTDTDGVDSDVAPTFSCGDGPTWTIVHQDFSFGTYDAVGRDEGLLVREAYRFAIDDGQAVATEPWSYSETTYAEDPDDPEGRLFLSSATADAVDGDAYAERYERWADGVVVDSLDAWLLAEPPEITLDHAVVVDGVKVGELHSLPPDTTVVSFTRWTLDDHGATATYAEVAGDDWDGWTGADDPDTTRFDVYTSTYDGDLVQDWDVVRRGTLDDYSAAHERWTQDVDDAGHVTVQRISVADDPDAPLPAGRVHTRVEVARDGDTVTSVRIAMFPVARQSLGDDHRYLRGEPLAAPDADVLYLQEEAYEDGMLVDVTWSRAVVPPGQAADADVTALDAGIPDLDWEEVVVRHVSDEVTATSAHHLEVTKNHDDRSRSVLETTWSCTADGIDVDFDGWDLQRAWDPGW